MPNKFPRPCDIIASLPCAVRNHIDLCFRAAEESIKRRDRVYNVGRLRGYLFALRDIGALSGVDFYRLLEHFHKQLGIEGNDNDLPQKEAKP